MFVMVSTLANYFVVLADVDRRSWIPRRKLVMAVFGRPLATSVGPLGRPVSILQTFPFIGLLALSTFIGALNVLRRRSVSTFNGRRGLRIYDWAVLCGHVIPIAFKLRCMGMKRGMTREEQPVVRALLSRFGSFTLGASKHGEVAAAILII